MAEVLGMRPQILKPWCFWKQGLMALPVMVLLGCAGGTESPPIQVEVIKAGQKALEQRRSERAPVIVVPQVTRAELDALDTPYLEVTIERRDVVGFVSAQANLTDDLPGKITVWRTTDNISLTTRNGILIATRGLGGDILSSSVQVTGSRPGPTHDGEHIQMVRGLDDREVTFAFGCEVVDLGPETIEIIDRRYPTRHIQQQCEGRKGSIVNDYWIDSTRGKVRKSRQWAGPNTGYLSIRRLNQ